MMMGGTKRFSRILCISCTFTKSARAKINAAPICFPMRYKLLCLVLLLEMLVVSTPMLRATDLRGGVVGLAGPLVGVGVALFEVKPNKTFRLVRQTVTAPDGKYQFTNVHPGQYVLRIGGINYPLEVRDTQMQDIPVIAKPRH
jgi:hypothetical protein